ncbi:MAG: ankyrin repeat domain-containing protein [Deltaproteobacteria bacterium]|nr:ankyrin repeat domain-containing protein [Deltaproteobacteria bacterium]
MKKSLGLFTILLMTLFFSGCTTISTTDNAAMHGTRTQLINLSNSGVNLKQKNASGYSPLAYAAMGGNSATAKYLIEIGADVNVKNNAGYTPLMFAALYASKTGQTGIINTLLDNGADPNLRNNSGKTAATLSYGLYSYTVVNAINAAAQRKALAKQRKIAEDKRKVEAERQRVLEQKKKDELLALIKKQPCVLKDMSWIYISGGCGKKYANGEGSAINISQNTSFDGKFKYGKMISGITYSGLKRNNRTLIFDGALRNGTPNGEGMCFYKGAPEKCEYYMGSRVDFLHKQRAELESQRAAMNEQNRKMDAKLKEMQKVNTYRAPTPVSRGGGSAAGDKIMNKVIDKGIGMLFDQLF